MASFPENTCLVRLLHNLNVPHSTVADIGTWSNLLFERLEPALPTDPAGWLTWASTFLLLCLLIEQLRFQLYKTGKGQNLPGPLLALPLLGGIVEMVKEPHTFWERQREAAKAAWGASWNSILSKFTVFVTDAALIRHVFNHNSKDTLLMALHPNAKIILGTKNIAFMHGAPHKALRKSFLALFTRRALSVYVQKQDAIIRNHIKEWMQMPGPQEMRPYVRDMNAFTSQEVFVGPYLDDPEVQEKFSDSYRAMTDGFLAFPISLAVWRGYQGRRYILKVLEKAAERSKQRMKEGKEPECLLDFWSQGILEEITEAERNHQPPPIHSQNQEMAYTVMDFLFASQDASTASLVWTLTLMAEHPEILEKVREEQYRVRHDQNATLTGETLSELTYTRQVVKEILRYRPPAPSVPQLAMKPFKLTDKYTIPKGTFIVPCLISACQQGFSNPQKFDPDRFGPERKEDVTYAKNFMVFGHGPHYCVGKEYAVNHLMAFLAIISTALDWTRVRSADSDWIKYLPTIYPYDSVMDLHWREAGKKEPQGL